MSMPAWTQAAAAAILKLQKLTDEIVVLPLGCDEEMVVVGWSRYFARGRFGRGDRIRTYDPLRPRQVRYQAALRPDSLRL